RLGELRVRREVEVGEQDQGLAQVPVLLRERLLDLDDHLGPCPDLVRRIEDGRPRRPVVLIAHAGADAGPRLDHDVVSSRDELVDAGSAQPHPVPVVLDLPGYPDPHIVPPCCDCRPRIGPSAPACHPPSPEGCRNAEPRPCAGARGPERSFPEPFRGGAPLWSAAPSTDIRGPPAPAGPRLDPALRGPARAPPARGPVVLVRTGARP